METPPTEPVLRSPEGADAFAPVSVMWTFLFLGFTVLLIPVEPLVIRRLTLGHGQASVAGLPRGRGRPHATVSLDM